MAEGSEDTTPIGRERPSYTCPCPRGKRAQRVLSIGMTGAAPRSVLAYAAIARTRDLDPLDNNTQLT